MNIEIINDDYKNHLDLLNADDVVVIDPPFNVGYKYKTYNDKMNESDYYDMLYELLHGRKCVVIHYPEQLHKLSIRLGYAPEKVITWVYNSNTGKQHRDIAFYKIKPDLSLVKQEYKNPNDKRIQKLILNGGGCSLYDWWEINQVKNVSHEKYNHPCQMPIEVMNRIVKISNVKTRIVDTFMGSGTTGVACKMNGIDFLGFELDKDYFNICKDRLNYIDKTGQMSIFTDFENV